MHKKKINPINVRIVDEIFKEKKKINETKKINKEKGENSNYNKLTGNLTAMIFRKYISNIINYHGLKYKVSNSNAFIENCPIEWDLIVLKDSAEDINNTNVFRLDDCVCLFEFKTAGLMSNDYKNINKTFEKQFNYINSIQNRIPFAYVSFCESYDYYLGTKEFFDKQNKIPKDKTSVFVFLDYAAYNNRDLKEYVDECNDFEKYLYDLFSLYGMNKKTD